MKKFFCLLIVMLSTCLLSGCFFIGGTFLNTTTPKSSRIDVSRISSDTDLVQTCKPAVVGISAINGRYQSIGTGVCINSNSVILTNYHVVENGNVINLYLSDGNTANASVVWTDPSSDLAMLKSTTSIPYLSLTEENSYQSGDEVIAIGTPLDLAFKHSATKGIISAVNRTISIEDNSGTTALYNLIQHDASINPGNSGGPLINLKGEIIGINTVKVTDAEGMGFAIPVDTFKNVVEKVSANGEYNTAYMGVFGYDYQLKNIGKTEMGYYIQDVAKNSPAEKMGLKKGDVIIKINDKNINLTRDLKAELYNYEVGDTVNLTIKNNNELRVVEVKLIKHPCCHAVNKVLTKN